MRRMRCGHEFGGVAIATAALQNVVRRSSGAGLTEVSSGDLVSMLATVDALYSSGVAGILVETEYDFLDFPVGPIIGSFDDVVAVPEPSMMTLIGCGVGGLVLLRRRRPA
jgi:hypothetical protein